MNRAACILVDGVFLGSQQRSGHDRPSQRVPALTSVSRNDVERLHAYERFYQPLLGFRCSHAVTDSDDGVFHSPHFY